MEIKGSAVKSIIQFVKNNYNSQYNEWLNSLSDDSKKVMKNPVLSSSWYPIETAFIEPTENLGQMFFNNPEKGAWISGNYSAEMALKGVYRIFIKASSPNFILKRAAKVFSTYYRPCEMKVKNPGEKSAILQITKFETPNVVVEHRIGGWIEKAMELSGCKNIKLEITKSMSKGDDITEFFANWN